MRVAADRSRGLHSMTIHVDLTDVAAHAKASRSLTGIQRVQLEYARALARRDDCRASIFSNLHGADVDLARLFSDPRSTGAEAIFMQMRRLFVLAPPVGLSPRALADARANGALKLRAAGAVMRGAVAPRRRAFEPSDCLYVGGAFWAHPRSVRTYEQAVCDGSDVVVLFHDVLPIAVPDLADGNCRPLYERMLRLRARALTVSRHSQAEIERARRALGAPADLPPARVVPLAHEFSAAPRNFVAVAPPSGRVAALERSGSFALCVGTVEARKNQLPLMRLWERLAREKGPAWPRLVVAGKRGWRAEETVSALKRADAAAPYAWVEAATDEELAWLYSRAAFTVFPSLAEGWGLPIGESLWFGKPCVASNAASMPEVGGSLCAYADPHAIDSFAAPILRLVHDADFHRASVAAIRASRLRTWRETADALLDATLPVRSRGADAPPDEFLESSRAF
jgi:glycosyltransferase involved in cell wall biosynthesis